MVIEKKLTFIGSGEPLGTYCVFNLHQFIAGRSPPIAKDSGLVRKFWRRLLAAMKWRFRFSMLGMFSAVTIVALGIALYQTHCRLKSSEAEVMRLRLETGHLSIADANKVHVIAVPKGDPFSWRWRIYLPGGHDFAVYAHCGKLDSKGFPNGRMLAVRNRLGGLPNPNEPREIIVDAFLGKTPEGTPCLWISENGQHVGGVRFGPALPSWKNGTRMSMETVAGRGAVVSTGVNVPLGLIRLDGVDAARQTCDDAVLIWISKYQDERTAMNSLKNDGILP